MRAFMLYMCLQELENFSLLSTFSSSSLVVDELANIDIDINTLHNKLFSVNQSPTQVGPTTAALHKLATMVQSAE
jgi:hypothetical protein